jgi:hypothetical protein
VCRVQNFLNTNELREWGGGRLALLVDSIVFKLRGIVNVLHINAETGHVKTIGEEAKVKTCRLRTLPYCQYMPQSRQSARPFLQSSGLGPPTPSCRRR